MRSGPIRARAAAGGHVVLAEVHAVRAAGRDEVRAVVEDEQRAVRVRSRAERRGRGHEPVVVQALVAQLDDVDAPAQRRREQRRQPRAPVARVADEVQPAGGDAVARGHASTQSSRRAALACGGNTGARTTG